MKVMDILVREAVIVELASETKNDAADGHPTHLFFPLVVLERSAGHHLRELAHAARFFRYPEFRGKLSTAKNLEDVFQAFEDEDSKFERCSYSSIEATRGE